MCFFWYPISVSNHFIALLITMANVAVIIVFFTFYIFFVRELSLKKIFFVNGFNNTGDRIAFLYDMMNYQGNS